MIVNNALCINSTRARTRVDAAVVDARLDGAALRAERAFGPTARRRARVARAAAAARRAPALRALRVRAARRRQARVYATLGRNDRCWF